MSTKISVSTSYMQELQKPASAAMRPSMHAVMLVGSAAPESCFMTAIDTAELSVSHLLRLAKHCKVALCIAVCDTCCTVGLDDRVNVTCWPDRDLTHCMYGRLLLMLQAVKCSTPAILQQSCNEVTQLQLRSIHWWQDKVIRMPKRWHVYVFGGKQESLHHWNTQ